MDAKKIITLLEMLDDQHQNKSILVRDKEKLNIPMFIKNAVSNKVSDTIEDGCLVFPLAHDEDIAHTPKTLVQILKQANFNEDEDISLYSPRDDEYYTLSVVVLPFHRFEDSQIIFEY